MLIIVSVYTYIKFAWKQVYVCNDNVVKKSYVIFAP